MHVAQRLQKRASLDGDFHGETARRLAKDRKRDAPARESSRKGAAAQEPGLPAYPQQSQVVEPAHIG